MNNFPCFWQLFFHIMRVWSYSTATLSFLAGRFWLLLEARVIMTLHCRCFRCSIDCPCLILGSWSNPPSFDVILFNSRHNLNTGPIWTFKKPNPSEIFRGFWFCPRIQYQMKNKAWRSVILTSGMRRKFTSFKNVVGFSSRAADPNSGSIWTNK